MLDRVARALHRAGIKAAKFDGRMQAKERNANVDKFRLDDSCEVLLVSLKAGGMGLSLTNACRAYLLEPYWNPATESQALDRIHRMGQKRPVVMTRYIIRNSIEERILVLQSQKLQHANSAGARRRAPVDRAEELAFLLRDSEHTAEKRCSASTSDSLDA